MKTAILLLLLILSALLFVKVEAIEVNPINNMLTIAKENTTKCLSPNNKHYCREGIKLKTKGTRSCYRYVKIALLKAGLISKYLGGISAVNAGKYLEKEGFINLLKKKPSPIIAPIGALMIYKTKSSKHGHIEIKSGLEEFVSDHIRQKVDGRLIGIYVKKDLVNRGYYDLMNLLHFNITSVKNTF
jgi:hypothetical protein